MLDTVREYVLDRLADSGELAAARQAHAEYFAALAEAAWTGLRRPEWQEWMERLELERDNLWAALAYAGDAPDPLVAARLGVGLGWYFGTAGRVSEGRTFVETALASAEAAPLALRIELLAYVCYLATEDDDLDAAIAAGQRGLRARGGERRAVADRHGASWRWRSRTTAPGRTSARSHSPRKPAARSTSWGTHGEPHRRRSPARSARSAEATSRRQLR